MSELHVGSCTWPIHSTNPGMKSVPVDGMDQSEGARIYLFGGGKSSGGKSMKELLGGKGAYLCEMARIGLNVPPGFVITTEVCAEFQSTGRLPEGLDDDLREGVGSIERLMGTRLGDPSAPLLLSVRSGAAISMPGMMETVLDLGLNDEVVAGVEKLHGTRFAYDCYRRLLQMFGDVVLGIPISKFEGRLSDLKRSRGVKHDIELSGEDLKALVGKYKAVYKEAGKELPTDPWEQLLLGVIAVFKSWDTPRAVKYREINHISGLRGTAVNVQAMVYGNRGDNSGTGVCFTRNPATGEKDLFGEYLTNAQGEDVVAGIRTPLPISALSQAAPALYQELRDITAKLEAHMGDMQDCEFTVQEGELFMLQTRSGKRTGLAALRIAREMEQEGLVTRDHAICMVEPRHLEQLMHPLFSDETAYRAAGLVLAKGLAASPGAGVGRVVFTAQDADAWRKAGERVVLVREETSPEDVGGLHAAEAVLTQHGGMTSHAAVVARGWGKPCVCGCEALSIDAARKEMSIRGSQPDQMELIREGDWLSINGTTGEVIQGKQPTAEPSATVGMLAEFMSWVDAARKLKVMANADTPADAKKARMNGAEGIGLCRTEHMFFATPERISAVRHMIAACELHSPAEAQALEAIAAFQADDFEALFRAMEGLPVTVRLLDPPLHEFLPNDGEALSDLCRSLADELHASPAIVRSRLSALRQANPMLGLRGCRLGVVHPEISLMQARAVFEAAARVRASGVPVKAEIMVPLVGMSDEMDDQAKVIAQAATQVEQKTGIKVPYRVGAMVEVPRGALRADTLAKTAQFFSFGTNDLTQMTYGISRDDAQARFLQHYIQHGLLPSDPFETLDQEGVGELIRIASARGRSVRPDLELGVCGEHGGDPASIGFFHKIGLDYVSCSPIRVPIARLAAAQAAIKFKSTTSSCPPEGPPIPQPLAALAPAPAGQLHRPVALAEAPSGPVMGALDAGPAPGPPKVLTSLPPFRA